MNLHRHIALALVAGATLVALASCGKTTSITSSVNAADPAPLAAPDGVTATFNSGTVRDILHWAPSASPSVASYEVYEAVTNPATGGIPTRIATTSAGASSLVLPEVSADCIKFYEVRSKDAAGNASAFSAPAMVARHAQPSAGNSGGGGQTGGGNKIGD